MNILGIIPARYASTRFPGKPLADINGKTMVQRVYEQASKAKRLSNVLIATDDDRIFGHVTHDFGGEARMTSPQHQSGTDRCAEIIRSDLNGRWDVVINIQGDEPYIQPEQIDLLCSCFNNEQTQIATLIKEIQASEELFLYHPSDKIGDWSGEPLTTLKLKPFLVDNLRMESVYCSTKGRKGSASGQRVFRRFPMIDHWVGMLTLHVFEDEIKPDKLENYLRYAGYIIGVGRFRPENGGHLGRFEVVKTIWKEFK